MRIFIPTLCALTLSVATTAFAAAPRDQGVSVAPQAQITRVQPSQGPADGRVVLTISGREWQGAAPTVTMGTVPAEVLTAQSNRIEVLVPAGLAEGPQDVMVDDINGSDSMSGAYTVTAQGTVPGPVILTIDHPGSGVPDTGAEVCINGRYFAEGVAVVFGDNPSTEVTFHSSEKICAIAPYVSGPTVTVINPDNAEAQFTYILTPSFGDGEDCACTTVKSRSPAPTSTSMLFLALVGGLVFWRRRK